MDDAPWDKIPDEPARWFDRFDTFYRPLGPGRTLTEAYRNWYKSEHAGKAPDRAGYQQDWKDVYDRWEWKRRAEAWDNELRQQKIAQEKEEHLQMSQRHSEAAKALQALALETLLTAGIKDPNLAMRTWRQAVTVERAAAGVPDHLIEITEMDDEDLNEEIAKRLKKSGLAGFFGEDEQDGEGEDSGGADTGREPSDGHSDSGPTVSSDGGVSGQAD